MARRTANQNATNDRGTCEDQIKDICFGIEIEGYGLNVSGAARVLQTVFGGEIRHGGAAGYLDRHYVLDAEGREWSIVRDGSVEGGFEFVSPICSMAQGDIEKIQEIIRALREAGARATDGTGLHIHIDARQGGTGLDKPQSITRFVKMFYAREQLFAKAFGASDRMNNGRWCRPTDEATLQRLIARGVDSSQSSLATAWYGSPANASYARHEHYHQSRYRGVNLHSLFTRGTVELRYFGSPLKHAGKFRAYVLFCLAVAAKARNGRHSSSKKVEISHGNEKYAMRSFMLKLGMNGETFKTSREHLLAPLAGNAARAGVARENATTVQENAA